MVVKLYSVKAFDQNGDDWTYTICAEDLTEAAVLALESHLEDQCEGDMGDLRRETCGNVEVTAIATPASFNRIGVVDPEDVAILPVGSIIDLVAQRREMGAPSL